MVVMYSGQQKFGASTVTPPVPPPPPLLNPANPLPRTRVSVFAGPSCGSTPVDGAFALASFGAFLTCCRGFDFGSGSDISGFGAGAVSGFLTSGCGACTVGAAICV